jgi:hypothetical protein
MKKRIVNAIGVCAIGLAAPQIVQAQGTTYLSNLNLTPTGSNPVGSDSWLAAGVYTGNNTGGYTLNSVQLALTGASGNPSGFSVMLYANDGNPFGENPGSSLGTLTGSLNPVSGGVYTFTADSSITLLPSTQYYIVLTAGTSIASGAYSWNYTGTSSYQPGDSWVASVTLSSNNGSVGSWYRLGANAIYDFSQFAITATPVPEPSPKTLLGLGSILLLGFGRWKAKAVNEKAEKAYRQCWKP